MAEGGVQNIHVCDWCLQDDKTVSATQFCVDCSNKLCHTCVESHKKCKPLKDHTLKNIEESDSDLKVDELARNLQKCSKHPLEVVKYICRNHDEVFCNECAIVTHRKCDDLVLLSEECANKKTSGNSTLESLTELEEQATALLSHEEDNKRVICESMDRVVNELKGVKNEIDDAFKTLEQNVMSDVAQRTQDNLNESDTNRGKIEQLTTEIVSTKRNAELFADKGDPVLRYLFDRQQRKLTGTFHSRIHDLVEKTMTRDIKLVHLKPVSEICDMITGSLKVEEVISTPSFSFRQSSASDNLPENRDFTQRNATFEYEAVIGNYLPTTAPSCVWVGKNIIFNVIDYCHEYLFTNLLVFDIDKRAVVHSLKCDTCPNCLIAIDDKSIAVCYGTKSVQIFLIQQGQLKHQKIIQTVHNVYAISMNKIDNELICLSKGVFVIVSLNDLIVRNVGLDSITTYETSGSPVRIAYNSNTRLVYVSIYAGKVISIDRTGHKLNELVSNQHVDINIPRGITVDTDGNVYILNNGAKTIIQCDKHLKYIRSIVTNEVGAECMVFNDDFTKFGLITYNLSDFTMKLLVFSFN